MALGDYNAMRLLRLNAAKASCKILFAGRERLLSNQFSAQHKLCSPIGFLGVYVIYLPFA